MLRAHRFRFPAMPSRLESFVARIRECLPDRAPADDVAMATAEALSNAIVHGALGLSSDLRDSGKIDEYLEMIDRAETERGHLARVCVAVSEEPEGLRIAVRDCGQGFNPRRDEPFMGQGIALLRRLTDEVSWNDEGNEVALRWLLKPVS